VVPGSGDDADARPDDHGAGGAGPDDPSSSRRARAVTGASVVLAVLLALGVAAALREGDPRDGLAAPTATPTRSAPAVADVDWRRVVHPLECGPLPRRVLDVEVADVVPGEGPEAVVVLRCDAGAGSPPSAVFVYDRGSLRTRPATPVATLLDAGEDVLLDDVAAREGEVTGEGYGYGAPDVPRCCPDRHDTYTWTWTGGGFERATSPVPTGAATGEAGA
jgi:hypothetical protein